MNNIKYVIYGDGYAEMLASASLNQYGYKTVTIAPEESDGNKISHSP